MDALGLRGVEQTTVRRAPGEAQGMAGHGDQWSLVMAIGFWNLDLIAKASWKRVVLSVKEARVPWKQRKVSFQSAPGSPAASRGCSGPAQGLPGPGAGRAGPPHSLCAPVPQSWAEHAFVPFAVLCSLPLKNRIELLKSMV